MKIKDLAICCKQTTVHTQTSSLLSHNHWWRRQSHVFLWLLQMTRSQLAGGKSLTLFSGWMWMLSMARHTNTKTRNSMDKWMNKLWNYFTLIGVDSFIQILKRYQAVWHTFTNLAKIKSSWMLGLNKLSHSHSCTREAKIYGWNRDEYAAFSWK